MSLTLSEQLLNYAIESGEVEDPSQMGAVEITVITDETQSELEETVADVADTVEKLENNDAAAEKIVEAVDSLESAVARLGEMAGENISLTPQAMQFYIQSVTASLECRDIPASIYKDAVVSMQHSFESAQLEDYTQEAAEKTESLIKRLVNMLKTAVQAAVTFIKEFFARLGKNGTAIAAAGKKLQAVASAVKGTAEGEVSGNYAALTVGGSVNPTAALKQYVSGYATVNSLTQRLQQAIANGLTGSGDAPAAAAIDLPGGAKAEYKPGEGEGLAKVAKSHFSITKPSTGSAKAAPLDAAGIKALGAELVQVGNLMTSAVKDGNKYVAGIEKFLAGTESKLKGLSDDKLAEASKAVKEARSALNASKTFLPKYLSYMGGAAKSAYKFGMASAAKHKVAKPE